MLIPLYSEIAANIRANQSEGGTMLVVVHVPTVKVRCHYVLYYRYSSDWRIAGAQISVWFRHYFLQFDSSYWCAYACDNCSKYGCKYFLNLSYVLSHGALRVHGDSELERWSETLGQSESTLCGVWLLYYRNYWRILGVQPFVVSAFIICSIILQQLLLLLYSYVFCITSQVLGCTFCHIGSMADDDHDLLKLKSKGTWYNTRTYIDCCMYVPSGIYLAVLYEVPCNLYT